MSTRLLALALLAVAVLACNGLPTPGASTPPASTPDIEATVRAAVRAALPTPVSGEAPDLGATVVFSVQATVEAMLGATPVPAAIEASVAAATSIPTPVPEPATLAMATSAEAATPAPTLAPAPTALPTPFPTSALASAFLTASTPAPTLALAPIATPITVPTRTPSPMPTPTPTPTPTPPPLPPSECQPAADGAVVTAWVEGGWAASTTVRNGVYVLFVDQGDGSSYIGKTVTFKIGDLDADESGIWEAGGGDDLELTAAPLRWPDPTPASSSSLPMRHLRGGLLAQPLLPHVFVGRAFTCAAPTPTPTHLPPSGCQPAGDGVLVTAWVGGVQAASATVQDGRYVLFVDQGAGASFPGKTVTFKIGDLEANESGIWEAGGGDDLDLTAAPARAPEPTPAPSTLLPRSRLRSGVLAQPVPPHVFLGKASICG